MLRLIRKADIEKELRHCEMRQLLILVINIRYEAVRLWVPPQLLPPQPLLQQQP